MLAIYNTVQTVQTQSDILRDSHKLEQHHLFNVGINLLLIKTRSLDIFFTRTKLRALFHGAVRCKLSFLMYMLQGLNIPLDFSPFLLLFSSVPAAVQTFCATKLNIINMSVCFFLFLIINWVDCDGVVQFSPLLNEVRHVFDLYFCQWLTM